MADLLRDNIRKYEAEHKTRLLCMITRLRCVSCPASGLGRGCAFAKWQLARQSAKRKGNA